MPPENEARSGSPSLRIRVGPRPRSRPEHKRLTFTADQWHLLAGLAASPLPPQLRPVQAARGTLASDERLGGAGRPAERQLRAAGVLTDAAEPTPAPQVAQSLALLAASPVAVHVTVAGRAAAREVWWAMNTARAAGVYLRADGGVDWVVCAAADMAALLPAVVPDVAALDPEGALITSALTTQPPSRPMGGQRQRFSVPLALLTPADPLAPRIPDADDADGGHSREDRSRADALLSGCRGTLVAHVYATAPATAPVLHGERSWLATAEGWLSLSRQPRPTRPGATKPGTGPRVWLTSVLPGDLPASLAPLLTDAFRRLAAPPAGAPGPAATDPSDVSRLRGTDCGQESTAGGR
jgi:hypothetical protein